MFVARKGRSKRDFLGAIHQYEDNGRIIGKSEPSIIGGYINYDRQGRKIGYSSPKIFGGYTHYDKRGRIIGKSESKNFKGYVHKDAKGRMVSTSDHGLFGGYQHKNTKEGCYIATCVYGSYESPQVMTLRRFRDNTLSKTFLGRLFIRAYYSLSPALVKRFGGNKSFRAFFKALLDRVVNRLNSQNSPKFR